MIAENPTKPVTRHCWVLACINRTYLYFPLKTRCLACTTHLFCIILYASCCVVLWDLVVNVLTWWKRSKVSFHHSSVCKAIRSRRFTLIGSTIQGWIIHIYRKYDDVICSLSVLMQSVFSSHMVSFLRFCIYYYWLLIILSQLRGLVGFSNSQVLLMCV